MIPDVGGNDRLAGRTFFRVVPRLLLNNAVAYGLGNQLSDFVAVQGNDADHGRSVRALAGIAAGQCGSPMKGAATAPLGVLLRSAAVAGGR